HPSLQGLRRFLLGTRDAHGLYQQFGFQPLPNLAPWMQIHKPNVYKETMKID
ncbi:MAG: N-acetyltransferase, partial [Chitinophagaceae bacterium]